MREYTPDTKEVSIKYRLSSGQTSDAFNEFNRWLEQVKAEAWREGARDMVEAIGDEMGTLTFLAPYNPYERPTKTVRDVIAENGGISPTVEAWA